MLQRGDKVFFRLPDESRDRILHPAVVVASETPQCTAELAEPDARVQPDQALEVYYEIDCQLHRQAARVLTVFEGERGPLVSFVTVGEPESAQDRKDFRVSTAVAGLSARVGTEDDCPLLDASASGFAVVASRQYCVGQLLPVHLEYGGEVFAGRASIQSVRPLADGRVRYGLRSVDDRLGGQLGKGLREISTMIQRDQLRRRSRA
jgi:hypothetical protein